jgi:deazaflavin-dependent oxidoreductase (nitroreductase family)
VDTAKMLAHNAQMIEEFRTTGGTLGAFGDGPVLLLTTIGARSGKQRTSPMMYLADPDDPDDPRVVYVFASKAGADDNPAWFHNLVAHPEVTVEIGRETRAAVAEPVAEPERTRLYAIQAGRFPGFAEYERRTSRTIPVVALTLAD